MTITETNIVVDCPVRVVYDQWTQFEQFPQFMADVEQVEQLTDSRLHWTVQIAGQRREWDADILEQIPDRTIAWASVAGARNAGRVSFAPVDEDHTEITLELEFEPDGLLDKVGDTLGVVGRRAEADLEHFKEFIEARGRESGGWRGRIGGAETLDPTVGGLGADPSIVAAPTQADRLLREP
jgi:uncharacterized membrane protein